MQSDEVNEIFDEDAKIIPDDVSAELRDLTAHDVVFAIACELRKVTEDFPPESRPDSGILVEIATVLDDAIRVINQAGRTGVNLHEVLRNVADSRLSPEVLAAIDGTLRKVSELYRRPVNFRTRARFSGGRAAGFLGKERGLK